MGQTKSSVQRGWLFLEVNGTETPKLWIWTWFAGGLTCVSWAPAISHKAAGGEVLLWGNPAGNIWKNTEKVRLILQYNLSIFQKVFAYYNFLVNGTQTAGKKP